MYMRMSVNYGGTNKNKVELSYKHVSTRTGF